VAAGQVQREADRIERDPTDVGGHIQALFDSYMGAQHTPGHTPWRLLDTHHRHMERLCHTLPRRLWEITRDDAKFLARTGLVGGAVTLTGKASCFILRWKEPHENGALIACFIPGQLHLVVSYPGPPVALCSCGNEKQMARRAWYCSRPQQPIVLPVVT